MEIVLALPIIASFVLIISFLPFWIKRAENAGLEGKDMNKYDRRKVAEAGGVVVIAGFVLGIFLYVALKTFYFNSQENLVEIFVIATSVIIMAFIGMIDDILGWKIGLGKKIRVFLVLIAAVPLMVINAGDSHVSLFGVNGAAFGLIYALFLIPLGIVGATTTFNFLAGYNGLEAGQGVIILSALSLVAHLTGNSWLALIGLCFVFALLAFLFFNKYPAKVFPGDVLTYPVGGMIAIMAILGNMEKVALFFFIPYIIEVFLKARGNLRKQSFGKPNKDGSLETQYKKIYGLEHLAIRFLKKVNGRATEKGVVYTIYAFQIVVIIIGLLIFRKGIF
ncbi:MAG: glycosyltransferase 4 family protein [Nanoarchaeota archaeon]